MSYLAGLKQNRIKAINDIIIKKIAILFKDIPLTIEFLELDTRSRTLLKKEGITKLVDLIQRVLDGTLTNVTGLGGSTYHRIQYAIIDILDIDKLPQPRSFISDYRFNICPVCNSSNTKIKYWMWRNNKRYKHLICNHCGVEVALDPWKKKAPNKHKITSEHLATSATLKHIGGTYPVIRQNNL